MNLTTWFTNRKELAVCFLLVIFAHTEISGQIKNIGLPFINNYSREDYSAGTQNWAITQDNDGIMYFANNDGMLEFDGIKWVVHPLPNRSVVRCVAYLDSKIFAGGYDEFGYFEADATGNLVYHSVSEQIVEKNKSFGEIWRIYKTRYGIVFQGFTNISILKFGKLEVIQPASQFGFSYFVNNSIFVIDRENGLYILKDKELIPYYINTTFFKKNEITFLISRGTNQYLLGTTNNGVFVLNGDKLTEWTAEINNILKRDQIYSAIELPNEMLGIGSIQNGLYIINMKSEIVQHINRYKGLQNNTVLSLFYDRDKNLWLGLDNGIDMLELSLPLTTINYCYNIETSYSSIVHDGILFIGTNQGLFARKLCEVDNNYSIDSGFELVEGTMGQVWTLKVFDNTLFCGHNLGTFIIKDRKAYHLSDIQGGWDYAKPKGKKDYLIGGTYNGLILFRKVPGSPLGWKFDRQIARFKESCKEIVIDTDGAIWISHGYKGVYRIILSENMSQVINATLYNTASGLPPIPYSVTKIMDKTVIVTSSAFYTYNKSTNTFRKFEKLNKIFSGMSGLTKVIEDYLGDLWFFTGNGMGVFRLQEDGTYSRIVLPFLRINNQYISSSFENVYVLGKNIVFIGSQRGMIHYDPMMIKDFRHLYKAYIGQVIIKGRGNDSIINNRGNIEPDGKSGKTIPEIPYRYNSISLSYLSPFYEAPAQISYSFRLIGFDDEWSEWTKRTVKEYTNLKKGNYTFEVKARNIYNNISDIACYTFEIEAPFYSTRVAYAFYISLIITIGLLNFLYFKRRIEKARQYEKLKHKKELFAREKQFKEEVELSEQKIEELKHENLLTKMRHKNMELANSTMHLIQKNKFLTDLKGELLSMYSKASNQRVMYDIKTIVHKIDHDIRNEKHWQVFDKYFDEVHQDFINKLRKLHPVLTPKDLRMCSYLKMNLTTKEIASLMNISIRGVEISRYRLRRKMRLGRNVNLTEYIINI